MKTHTIIMMLTLVVAGVVIGCSSEPVANLTENEVIAIARSSESRSLLESQGTSGCWYTEARPYYEAEITSNFFHTESASFKASGIWVVMAKTSWDSERPNSAAGTTIYNPKEYSCIYVVDDATGRVTQN